MSDPFTNKEVREYVRDAESDTSQLKARVKELEDLSHKQRALEAQLQGEINHLEAENAELRAELFCNENCTWLDHHVACSLMTIRASKLQQADDEGEA